MPTQRLEEKRVEECAELWDRAERVSEREREREHARAHTRGRERERARFIFLRGSVIMFLG